MQRSFSTLEVQQVLDSIKEEICVKSRMYSHEYKPGDFIISDNLAVGHEADPATQLPREEVGLRVMHRVTIAGSQPPRKSSATSRND